MADFKCVECDYGAHFSEFKTGTHIEVENDEEIDVDDVECPRCGSDDVYEL